MRLLIKKTLKRVLRMAGFYPSKMRGDMEDVLIHLKSLGVMPATIFDVGVADGTRDMYQAYPDCHFILVEPLREFEQDIMAIRQQYHVDFVVAAAADKAGRMHINVHPDLCGSSLLKEKEGGHVDGTEREVPVIRLDELALERKLTAPYMIKIDVQGGELTVLDGCTAILPQTEVVILEVSLFEFFIDGPEFADVIAYMRNKGFVVYEIFDGRNRPLDGALAQVDILFIPEQSPLRKQHIYATENQRSIQNKKIKKMMAQAHG